MGEMQIVVFALNNETCGADTSQVQEIVKYQDVTSLPGIPDFVEGVISIRGRVIPVVNLNKRLDLGAAEVTKKTKIIITGLNDSHVGFIVNDVSEIIMVSGDDIEATPEIISRTGNTYLKGVGKRGGQLVSILDLYGILTDSEVNRIKDIDKKEQP